MAVQKTPSPIPMPKPEEISPRNYVGDPSLLTKNGIGAAFINWDNEFMQKGLPPPVESHESGTPAVLWGRETGFGRVSKGDPGDPTGRLLETNTGQPYKPGIQGDPPYIGSAAGVVSETEPEGGPHVPAPRGVPPGDVGKMNNEKNPMPFAHMLAPMLAHMGGGTPEASEIPEPPFQNQAPKMHGKKETHPVSDAQRRWAFPAEERGDLPKGTAHEWSKRKEGEDLPEHSEHAEMAVYMRDVAKWKAKMRRKAKMKGKADSSIEGRGAQQKPPGVEGMADDDQNTQKSLDALIEALMPLATTGDLDWEEVEMRKAEAGEGSRGGHVVGHTKGGKPIYEVSAHSGDRYRASAASRRLHGGGTETEFHIHDPNTGQHYKYTGKGPSPGERRTHALQQHARAMGVSDTHQMKHSDTPKKVGEKSAPVHERLAQAQKDLKKLKGSRYETAGKHYVKLAKQAHYSGDHDRMHKLLDRAEEVHMHHELPLPDEDAKMRARMRGKKKQLRGKIAIPSVAYFRRSEHMATDIYGRTLRSNSLAKAEESIPEEYLYDYLCGQIEQCYEQERRETEHQNVSARDQIVAMAQMVMHGLVLRMRYDSQLVRACKAYKVTMPVVQAILVAKGIYKPKADSDWASDKDSNAAMGMPVNQGIANGVFEFSRGPNPWMKSEATPQQRAELRSHIDDASSLVKSDYQDPHMALHALQQAQMRAQWTGDDAQAVPTVADDCPVHNGRDISKAQNLFNAQLPCTCGARPNAYG